MACSGVHSHVAQDWVLKALCAPQPSMCLDVLLLRRLWGSCRVRVIVRICIKVKVRVKVMARDGVRFTFRVSINVRVSFSVQFHDCPIFKVFTIEILPKTPTCVIITIYLIYTCSMSLIFFLKNY